MTSSSADNEFRQQPETSSVVEWLEQRSFLFGIELRGDDENFVLPQLPQQSETLRLVLLSCFKASSAVLGLNPYSEFIGCRIRTEVIGMERVKDTTKPVFTSW